MYMEELTAIKNAKYRLNIVLNPISLKYICLKQNNNIKHKI